MQRILTLRSFISNYLASMNACFCLLIDTNLLRLCPIKEDLPDTSIHYQINACISWKIFCFLSLISSGSSILSSATLFFRLLLSEPRVEEARTRQRRREKCNEKCSDQYVKMHTVKTEIDNKVRVKAQYS